MIKIMQLRIPKELKEYLQKEAIKKGYSLNALMLKILWEYKENEEIKDLKKIN